MKKLVIKYGLISGLLISAFMAVSMLLLDDASDLGNAELIGYASMILAFSLIFVATKQYKNRLNDEPLKFGKAFLIGLYITLICSTLYVLTWMIMTAIDPSIMEGMKDMYLEKINSSGLSAEEIKTKISEFETSMEYYANPFIKAMITYMEILPVGLVVSLISAFIFRTRNA